MPKHFSVKTSTVNCTFEPTECESVNKEHKKNECICWKRLNKENKSQKFL